jgi:hypothetical protein
MKKRAFALAIACALTLAACRNDTAPQPTGPVKEIPCPDPKHPKEPCR